jgi:hypothetical protein
LYQPAGLQQVLAISHFAHVSLDHIVSGTHHTYQATQNRSAPDRSDPLAKNQAWVANLRPEWLLPTKNDTRADVRSSMAQMEKMTRTLLCPFAVHPHVKVYFDHHPFQDHLSHGATVRNNNCMACMASLTLHTIAIDNQRVDDTFLLVQEQSKSPRSGDLVSALFGSTYLLTDFEESGSTPHQSTSDDPRYRLPTSQVRQGSEVRQRAVLQLLGQH